MPRTSVAQFWLKSSRKKQLNKRFPDDSTILNVQNCFHKHWSIFQTLLVNSSIVHQVMRLTAFNLGRFISDTYIISLKLATRATRFYGTTLSRNNHNVGITILNSYGTLQRLVIAVFWLPRRILSPYCEKPTQIKSSGRYNLVHAVQGGFNLWF